MEEKEEYDAKFVAIGIHSGTIYVRGKIRHVGRKAKTVDVNEKDLQLIKGLVEEFSKFFNPENKREKMSNKFTKIAPLSHRPCGKLYS